MIKSPSDKKELVSKQTQEVTAEVFSRKANQLPQEATIKIACPVVCDATFKERWGLLSGPLLIFVSIL